MNSAVRRFTFALIVGASSLIAAGAAHAQGATTGTGVTTASGVTGTDPVPPSCGCGPKTSGHTTGQTAGR